VSLVGLPPAIETRGLRRVYKAKPHPVVALDGIDLDVAAGEFFGLLGPNGAGKTTLIKILTTLLLPTSGTASVAGFDVVAETARIRRVMNMVSGGEQSGYGILTVREQLWMFSQFYGLGTREGWRRTDELIELVGLAEQRLQRVSGLSTGQRQKLNLARGFVNDPWILFLDEPTLGLDVSAARDVRDHFRRWRAAVPGRTALLTTHYMAEADELCDRVAIVDRGRILALGTPADLKRRVQRESLFRIEVDRLPDGTAALARLPGVLSASISAAEPGSGSPDGVAVSLALAEDGALAGVVTALAEAAVRLRGLAKSEPTLEDVFVELVGRGLDERDGTREPVATPGSAVPRTPTTRRRARPKHPPGAFGGCSPRTCGRSPAGHIRASAAASARSPGSSSRLPFRSSPRVPSSSSTGRSTRRRRTSASSCWAAR
jgi:ABC-2 type transport system ATP-binding protein